MTSQEAPPEDVTSEELPTEQIPGDGTTGPSPAQPEALASDWIDRLRPWHLALLFCLLLLPGLATLPLFEPDEGRYAEIPREMLASGDFVTPRLNGVLYLEKPVLYYWLNALSVSALGRNELSVRLPGALFSLLGVLLAFHLARSMAGHRAGVYAAMVLGTSPMWVTFGHVNSIDMTLSVLVLLALVCFWHAIGDGPSSGKAWYGLFAASALALLTKGLIGIVLPGAIIGLFLLLTWGWRTLLRVPWISGSALFALIAVPWHVLAAQRTPDFLWFYFVREHFLRYTTDIAAREGPWWYFLPVAVVGLLPWIGLLPAAARFVRRELPSPQRSQLIFLASWIAFIFLFFSASSSKLVPYVLPAFPPLAVLLGLTLAHAETAGGRRRVGWGLAALAPLTLLLQGAFLWFGAGLSAEKIHGISMRSPWLVVVAALGMVATAMGAWFAVHQQWRPMLTSLGASAMLLAGGLIAAASPVAQARTSRALATCIAQQQTPDVPIVSFRIYPQGLPFYLGRLIDVSDYAGELEFGISKLTPETRARRFPTVEALRQRWNSPRAMYLVTKRNGWEQLVGYGFEEGTTLLTVRKWALYVNAAGSSKLVACEE